MADLVPVPTIHVPEGIVYIGQDTQLYVPVRDRYTRAPIDVSSFTIRWTVRDDPAKVNSPSVHISKTNDGINTGIAFATSDIAVASNIANDVVVVNLNASDTYSGGSIIVDPGWYVHGVWRIDNGLFAPIGEGPFYLTRGAGGTPV